MIPSSVKSSVAISAFKSLSSTRRTLFPSSFLIFNWPSACFGFLSSSFAIFNGSVIVKVEPAPGLLWTVILPFIKSTSFFTIPMPSPLPSIPLSDEDRSCENDSKICFWNSSDIPIPLSAIISSNTLQPSFSPGYWFNVQLMLPPSPVYFTALLKMLIVISDDLASSIYRYGYRMFLLTFSVWCFSSIGFLNISIHKSKFLETSVIVSSSVAWLFSIRANSRMLSIKCSIFFPHNNIFSK